MRPALISVALVLAAMLLVAMACLRVPLPDGPSAEPDPTPRVVLPDESMYRPSPQDGGGAVSITPGVVRAGKPCTLTLSYTVGEQGIATGGGVLCNVSSFWYWTPPQQQAPELPGYTSVKCSNPAVRLAVEVDPGSMAILARINEGTLGPGDRITIVYGDTDGGANHGAQGRADRYAEREEQFHLKVDGDGDGFFVALASQATFDVQAGEASQLVCVAPSQVTIGEPFELRISALDSMRNLDEQYAGEIVIAADGDLMQAPAAVTMGPHDGGSIGVQVTARAAGVARLAVQDRQQRLAAALSNVIVMNEPTPRRYHLLWADLHMHGNLSDGTGTPEDLYRYARDVAGLDVAAVTEHDHWGYVGLDENPAGWQRVCSATEQVYDRGRFVSFFAYEWTSWTFGHQHLLFRNREDAVVRSWHHPDSDHVSELLAALSGTDCIAIPHHPGGGPVPYFWKYHDPTLQPVVEIVSVHGVSEQSGGTGCIYHPVASGMVQSALARGYRLGIIGGGDTHDGHPGLGSPGMPPPGLACVYAEEPSREAALAAIRARRVYATNGCRTVLRFHSGATAMGGELSLAELDGPPRFDIAVVAGADITAATIIKSNRDYAMLDAQGQVITTSWQDPEPAADGDFYYLRVTDGDGCAAWSSPIWVTGKPTGD